MTTRVDARPVPAAALPTRRRAGTATAVRWEIVKLAAQAKARYTLLAVLVAPVAVVLVLHSQQRPPKDTLFGRHIAESGYAMPLLVLGFAAQWVLPLLTSLVAGDIVASEDQQGTWKTVLTRSVSRSQLFWAKTLVAAMFAVLVLVVLTASTVVSSMLGVGTQPLVGLTGQLIPSGTAAPLVVASWLSTIAPLLGFTALAILLSTWSRNPAVGVAAPVVVGLVLQLVGSLGGLDLVRRGLLTTPFEAWHGLLAEQRFYGPLVTGLVVSAAWTVVCLALAHRSLRRRDITGG
ncbi:MAG: type transport system permease protein [Frankiaceae bacterium]|nr:type transport system permease protein [Frankiaceae bacterium]